MKTFSRLIWITFLVFFMPGRGAIFDGKCHAESKGRGVVIRQEKGPSGHATIGIDESRVKSDTELAVTFSTLMTWDYDAGGNPPPPGRVKKLEGQIVRLTGFMYPLQEGAWIQYFCLLRTTQTCCYGPRPQLNQYVLVEMEKPTRFYRIDAVTCVGRFRVEPTPEEGYIYRMEGQQCDLPFDKKGTK